MVFARATISVLTNEFFLMSDDIRQSADLIRHTSPQAIRLAKTLMRTARFGALAVIDAKTGEPAVSRVAVATALDGAPLILISSLSGHTQSLLENTHCSLLLGEPGKGDPLAHPRVTLQCFARFLDRSSNAGKHASERYLRHNPKAKLYADFGDFSFVRLEPKSAALNGGFGQAFRLTGQELLGQELLGQELLGAQLEEIEASILDHMNGDHADAVSAIGVNLDAKGKRLWAMTGADAEGVNIASGDMVRRAWFAKAAISGDDMRERLIELTIDARKTIKAAKLRTL
jgi:heme iron utilization protein